jgi:hypothetical protein
MVWTSSLSILFSAFVAIQPVVAIGGPQCLSFTQTKYAIVNGGAPATIWIDSKDWPGVHRAARDMQTDLQKVTGVKPVIVNITLSSADDAPGQGDAVTNTIPIIIGTLGKSSILNFGAQANPSLNQTFSTIQGKWEAGISEVIQNPFPGINTAYVIAGSDKRGTIYGIYDFLEQAGVSPW